MTIKLLRLRIVLLTSWFMLPGLLLAQPGGPALVEVSEAVEIMIAPVTQVAGTVVSRRDARIAAEQDGRVLEILEVGSEVAVGDVIARLDARPLELRVAELAADVERIRARLDFLQAEYQRQQELSARQLTSATTLEQTRSDQKVAASELAVAEARLAQAADDVDRAEVKAPFDGVLVERLVQIGERVNLGQVVVRLTDPQALEIVARPPLNYFSFVQRDQRLEVTTSHSSEFWPVRSKVSLGNEQIHVFEIRLDVNGEFYANGQTVRVSVPIAAQADVIAVPRDALVLRSDGTSVFVLQEDMTVRQVNVRAGVGDADLVGIEGDVLPGDRVIIRGNERLRPGQSVELVGA